MRDTKYLFFFVAQVWFCLHDFVCECRVKGRDSPGCASFQLKCKFFTNVYLNADKYAHYLLVQWITHDANLHEQYVAGEKSKMTHARCISSAYFELKPDSCCLLWRLSVLPPTDSPRGSCLNTNIKIVRAQVKLPVRYSAWSTRDIVNMWIMWNQPRSRVKDYSHFCVFWVLFRRPSSSLRCQ